MLYTPTSTLGCANYLHNKKPATQLHLVCQHSASKIHYDLNSLLVHGTRIPIDINIKSPLLCNQKLIHESIISPIYVSVLFCMPKLQKIGHVGLAIWGKNQHDYWVYIAMGILDDGSTGFERVAIKEIHASDSYDLCFMTQRLAANNAQAIFTHLNFLKRQNTPSQLNDNYNCATFVNRLLGVAGVNAKTHSLPPRPSITTIVNAYQQRFSSCAWDTNVIYNARNI